MSTPGDPSGPAAPAPRSPSVRALRRPLRLLRGGLARTVLLGIALGVIGEASSVALLGLSGWFIASSALAGATPGSTFGYVTPSAGVRAFALGRIAFRYLHRVVMHAATLTWLGRLRVQLLLDLAAAPPEEADRLRVGDALDRVMADVDTLDGLVLRVLSPTVVTAVVAAGSVAAVAAVSAPAAQVLALGAAATAAAAVVGSRWRDTDAEDRGAARAHLVASMTALPEMVSLGAVATLRHETRRRTAILSSALRRRHRHDSRTDAVSGAFAGITLLAVLLTVRGGTTPPDVPSSALVLLVAAGVVDLAAGLTAATRATTTAVAAARRLTVDPAPVPPAHHVPPDTALPVRVRALPLRPGDDRATGVDLEVPAGGTLVLTGRSGAGKTTVLRALAGWSCPPVASVLVDGVDPRALAPGRVVLVPHDDVVLAGTVADNVRLGAPDLDEHAVRTLLEALLLGSLEPAALVGPAGRVLSGGEVRRLVLARAAAARPGVLLLDEPTEGLAPDMATAVLDRLRALLPDTTFVLAVHDREGAVVHWPDAVHRRLGPPEDDAGSG